MERAITRARLSHAYDPAATEAWYRELAEEDGTRVIDGICRSIVERTVPVTDGGRVAASPSTCSTSAAGRPAAGIAVALTRVDGADGAAGTALGRVTTDVDGRAGGADAGWDALGPGTHELRYDVGAYFAATSPATPTFYADVPVRFVVTPDDTHVHLALLLSPWSYTTYRGS